MPTEAEMAEAYAILEKHSCTVLTSAGICTESLGQLFNNMFYFGSLHSSDPLVKPLLMYRSANPVTCISRYNSRKYTLNRIISVSIALNKDDPWNKRIEILSLAVGNNCTYVQFYYNMDELKTYYNFSRMASVADRLRMFFGTQLVYDKKKKEILLCGEVIDKNKLIIIPDKLTMPLPIRHFIYTYLLRQKQFSAALIKLYQQIYENIREHN